MVPVLQTPLHGILKLTSAPMMMDNCHLYIPQLFSFTWHYFPFFQLYIFFLIFFFPAVLAHEDQTCSHGLDWKMFEFSSQIEFYFIIFFSQEQLLVCSCSINLHGYIQVNCTIPRDYPSYPLIFTFLILSSQFSAFTHYIIYNLISIFISSAFTVLLYPVYLDLAELFLNSIKMIQIL